MNPDILILCATKEEISFFLDLTTIISQKKTPTRFTIINGEYQNRSFVIVITGVGIINTAHALTIILEKMNPDIIIQVGIAGVFKESGLNIGDIAIADTTEYIHTGIERGNLKNLPLPFNLIENNDASCQGVFSTDQDICNKAFQILSQNLNAQIQTGKIITVSTISSSEKKASKLFKDFNPLMEAMEGAGAAHIALLYKKPFIEIRTASNFVGQQDKALWDIPLAGNRISETLTILLNASELISS